MIPWWEGSVEDVSTEGPRPQQARARASVLATVIASATTRVVAMASLLPRIAMGTSAGVEGVAHITVEAKTFVHQDRSALLRLVD